MVQNDQENIKVSYLLLTWGLIFIMFSLPNTIRHTNACQYTEYKGQPMYEDLKNKTVLITGSGKKSGIGFAIAKKFASNGANIVISDLGAPQNPDNPIKTATDTEMQESAEMIRNDYKVDVLSVVCDVVDNVSISAVAEKVQKTFGQLDVLVNNAGATLGVPNTIHGYDEAAWMKTIDVNLHGVFRVSRGMLPLMMEKGGSIVNIASRAGKVPPLFNGAYAVAKSGVIMLTKVMAKELAGNGLRINAICPGQIMTDLEKWRFELEAQVLGSTFEKQVEEMCKTIALDRIGEPDEVAKLAVFLASDESSYMTGQAINVTGGQLMEL